MLKKLLTKREDQGFTIIEVLIVLAIAALILLIVFLAVPALQRNSRNTSRQRDAADVLASINEYVADNGGSLPASCSGTSSVIWAAGTTTTTSVSYYNKGCSMVSAAFPTAATLEGDAGQVILDTQSPAVATAAVPSGTTSPTNTGDAMVVVEGVQCGAAGVTTVGSARQFVALYAIENGPGTTSALCLSS